MCSMTGYMIAGLGLLQLAGISTIGTIVGGEFTTGALLMLIGTAYAIVARRTCAARRCAVSQTPQSHTADKGSSATR